MGFKVESMVENKPPEKTETNEQENLFTENLNDLTQEEISDPNPILKVKNLPSEFKLYPKGTETDITYKPYTWGEIRKLNSSSMPTKQLWEFVLSGITTDKSIKKTQLTLQDFYYIAFLRRASSIGRSNFIVESECYNMLPDEGKICKHKNSFTIKDSGKDTEIEFDNMDLESNQFPVVISNNDTTIEMTPITIQDCFVLMTKNLFSDESARTAIQIRNMKFDEAYNLILSDKINPEMGALIDEVENEYFNHRVKTIFKHCEKCKQSIAIQLDMGGTIIKPFRSNKDNGRVRISFGKTSK